MDEFVRPGKRSPFKTGTLDGLMKSEKKLPEGAVDDVDIPEPEFTPPDQVEAEGPPDTIPPVVEPGQEKAVPPAGKGPKAKKGRFKPTKKQWIIIAVAGVLLLGGGASGWYFFIRKKPVVKVAAPVVVEKKVEPPAPTTEASKLSGLEVPIGTNEKQVISVMIENSQEARPQAGLINAGVVFEAIAEGGITRFNALFQDTQPDYIGPVRSIRPYYIDWFWPFDAAVAHAGGSPKGLADVRALGIKDLDQFANSAAYSRVNNRYAPHNLYSSYSKLLSLAESKGFKTSSFTGFPRKKAAPAATPTAKTIDLKISSFYFNVHYDFDAANNGYLRSEGGAAHKDERSGLVIAPKVVVAVVMPRGIDGDGQHTDYKTTGSGKVYVFQDGTVTEGTWSKSARQSQWKFTDSAGTEIGFNPGQTWITMVDSAASVIYKP